MRRVHFCIQFAHCLTVLLAVLIVALGTAPAPAQVLYGTVVGTVSDSTGAVVPGATVTIASRQTNQTRQATTSDVGGYNFVNVLGGTYDLSVEAQGFRRYTRTGVEVSINTVTRVEVPLEVGELTEVVNVSAQAAVLQTDSADVHSEIGAVEVTNLPLSNYRNFQSLINLVPGATPAQFQNSINDTPMRSLRTNINGTIATANNTRVDGALNKMNIISSHVLYVPPSESIQTVNISTDAFDAEQGMTGGAAVTVVTKSGTNEFHGSVFAYNANNALQAKNFFFRGTDTPKSISNIYGGAIGGPIKSDRLFFFANWEGLRDRQSFTQLYTIPTAAQREGDFSAFATPIYDPSTGDVDGFNRTPFADARIPLNRQSSITRQMQGFAPLPNLPGTNANYSKTGTQVLDRDNYDIKVDWNRADRHTVWGKYSRMPAHVVCSPVLEDAGGGALCTGNKAGVADTLVQVGTLGHTWVLTPSLLIDGTVGYSRLVQDIVGPKFGEHFGLDVLGIPGTNGPDIRQSGQPAFIITGYETFGDGGIGRANPAFRTDSVYTHATNLSWMKGAHDVRIGFELVRFHQNDWQPNTTGGARGEFAFVGGITGLRGGRAPNQFNAYGAFLLGLPQSTRKAIQFYSPQTAREWQFGWYVRDRWQATPNLTLTLGLRYEYYPLVTRADQGIERYDPETNQVLIGRRGGNPDNVGIDVSKRLFAPRLGLAYRLGANTVFRSGYGISFDPTTVSGAIQRPYPVAFGKDFQGPNAFQPFQPIELGIPLVEGPDVSSGVLDLPLEVSTATLAEGLFRRGYIQSWNVTLEHRFPHEMIASLAYVGTQATRQMGTRNINAGSPGLGLAGRPLFERFGLSADTSLVDPAFSAPYHSLQATLNRRFVGGLFLKGAYTYAKAVNYTDGGGLTFNTASEFSRNRALAGHDRTHTLQMGWLYELPFGAGKPWASGGGLAGAVLGGWQINGIFSAYSGTPFNVTSSAASLNAPGNTQTADQVKAEVEHLGGIGIGAPWFDPDAFVPVTEVRFGNTGRNILRGPGAVNVELSVFRSFSLTEQLNLQFRAEAFNATNTPHFGQPAANASNRSNFGTITTAQQDQRTVRFGLRLSF